jgi:predicted metalloprotease
MAQASPSAAPPAPRRRAVVVVAASVGAILGIWAWSWLYPPASPAPLPADRAEVIARRIGVVLADTTGVWRRVLRLEAGRTYEPPELVLFGRGTPSPCAGTGLAAGPFYCRAGRTAAFDLAFLDNLSARLRRQADLGLALVVARVAAVHVQGELGTLDQGRDDAALALQADCLAGVWAAAAAGGLGPVPTGFYADLVRIGRNVGEDLAMAGPGTPEGLDMFAPGQLAAREAAFAAGYARGELAACPPPGG